MIKFILILVFVFQSYFVFINRNQISFGFDQKKKTQKNILTAVRFELTRLAAFGVSRYRVSSPKPNDLNHSPMQSIKWKLEKLRFEERHQLTISIAASLGIFAFVATICFKRDIRATAAATARRRAGWQNRLGVAVQRGVALIVVECRRDHGNATHVNECGRRAKQQRAGDGDESHVERRRKDLGDGAVHFRDVRHGQAGDRLADTDREHDPREAGPERGVGVDERGVALPGAEHKVGDKVAE